MKRQEAEDRQVVLIQEKNDLALQLQAVSHAGVGMFCIITVSQEASERAVGGPGCSTQDQTCALPI